MLLAVLSSRLLKALVSSAFFVALSPLTAVAGNCDPNTPREYARVAYVYDGDTVRLTDGRKLRLIGINTPELSRGNQPAQALAKAARDYVAGLLPAGRRIGLNIGPEPKDRYGRWLAHVTLADGSSLGAKILEHGLGLAIAVPPNIGLLGCYQAAERTARQAGTGVWSHPQHRAIAAHLVSANDRGFIRIVGRITSVKKTKKSIWLNLDGGPGLRIARSDLVYFGATDFSRLAGLRVTARGWLRPSRSGLVLRIRHPASLAFEDILINQTDGSRSNKP